MIFSSGLSCYTISIFHLATHAFVKALLFLSAGAIIHSIHNEKDMRKMGSLSRFVAFNIFCNINSSLSLVGFPFLFGFYPKDFILELSQVMSFLRFITIYPTFACWWCSISVIFTVLFLAVNLLTFINNYSKDCSGLYKGYFF